MSALDELLARVPAAGGTTVRTPGAIVVVVPLGGTSPSSGAELVRLGDAARIAATSVRVVRDAIRSRHLAAYGGQRDRAVRRGDLDVWIEERRLAPVAGPVDSDIDRRVRRLARTGRRTA